MATPDHTADGDEITPAPRTLGPIFGEQLRPGDCCGQAQGETCCGLVAESRVGPCGVVVGDPSRDQVAGMGKVAERRLVQEVVPHPVVEALDKAVLHQLAGLNVVPFDLLLGASLQDRVRGQFGAIFREDHSRLTVRSQPTWTGS